MSITYIISVFARELPGYFIFVWIFMPVTLFLVALIAYFRIQLSKVDKELARLYDPRNTLPNYNIDQQNLRRPRKNANKYGN
ncbi:hypothetical protein ASZ78_010016 [Callipepla squamata]|uniref:Uncharacterized protein n=1 Tax=Callipepla squamata TaxID=9009 RepID=A0A226NL21_CALSU|nr:hypothetical protein ASZ78_010016 [Callipepla squamata]